MKLTITERQLGDLLGLMFEERVAVRRRGTGGEMYPTRLVEVLAEVLDANGYSTSAEWKP